MVASLGMAPFYHKIFSIYICVVKTMQTAQLLFQCCDRCLTDIFLQAALVHSGSTRFGKPS